MPLFCLKNLSTLAPVGTQFRTVRTKLDIELPTLAERTRVPLKYLEAIEESRFADLPQASAFRVAYVREYAKALQLDAAQFSKQWQWEYKSSVRSIPEHQLTQKNLLTPSRFHLFSFSLLARNIAVGLLAVIFVGYLFWQVKGVLEPPHLAVFTPREGEVFHSLTVTIQGETEKETRLTINGRDAMMNERGQFETPVDLSVGVNTLTVSAIKKHGKTSTIVRHIVVSGAEAPVSTAPTTDNSHI